MTLAHDLARSVADAAREYTARELDALVEYGAEPVPYTLATPLEAAVQDFDNITTGGQHHEQHRQG